MSLEQWETYYRGGALATCPTAADGGYDLEVRQGWVEFFSTLPRQARVLDIGTGNGVVALIAKETAQATGCDWEIHGTDLAQIDPLRDVPDGPRRFAGITFHAGVASEHLPFDDASFDGVSGHYALEYCNVPAALAEVFRVMKPGAGAQFVLHHADSVLLAAARQSLLEGDLVFKDTKVFRRLHRLLTLENPAQATLQLATTELRAGIHALKQAWEQARSHGGGRVLGVALDAVQKLLQASQAMPPQQVGQEVERAEAELRASVRRLNDLVGHARDEQGMQAIEQTARAQGFVQIERSPQFHAGSNLVGWQLLLTRP